MSNENQIYQGVDKETFEKERTTFRWDINEEEEKQLPIWYDEKEEN